MKSIPWKATILIALMLAVAVSFNFLALKLTAQKFGLGEVVFVVVTLAACVWGASRVQKRRQRRRLESIRDSALW
jgi:hypothetical protein